MIIKSENTAKDNRLIISHETYFNEKEDPPNVNILTLNPSHQTYVLRITFSCSKFDIKNIARRCFVYKLWKNSTLFHFYYELCLIFGICKYLEEEINLFIKKNSTL